jgi:DNA replication protein DnaC
LSNTNTEANARSILKKNTLKYKFGDIDAPLTAEQERKSQAAMEKANLFDKINQKKNNIRSFTSLLTSDIEDLFQNEKVLWSKNQNFETKEYIDCVKKLMTWNKSLPFGLFLYGPAGCGKSHLLKCLILANASQEFNFKLLSDITFSSMMKDFDAVDYNHQELCKPYGLVLDDLGAKLTQDGNTKATEYDQHQLLKLLDNRRALKKPIFMSSNFSIKELKERYSERVVSRLGESMVFVENKGHSFRKDIFLENKKIFDNLSEDK